jgi:uncharacterized protein (TIGR02466 family)
MTPPDPFAPTQLFSFPLFASVLAGFEDRREALLRDILALRDANPGVVRSNRNAWHSGAEFFAQKSEHVAWVIQKVSKFAALSLGRYYQNWATSELKMNACWANVLGPGGWNAPHHHFPNAWSGVIYVSVPPDVGAVAGDPAGMIEFLNPTPWLSAAGQAGNFVYGPKNGLTLLFPASIYHFVHPHPTAAARVSIAYNFEVVPKRQGGS